MIHPGARPESPPSAGVDVMAGLAENGLCAQLMRAATAIVLIGTDRDGRITFCSSGAEQVLDTTHHDLVDRWLPAAAFGTGELSARMTRISRPDHAHALGVEISPGDRRRGRQVDLGPLDRRSSGRRPDPGASGEDWRRPRDWTITHADHSRLVVEMTATPVTDTLGEEAGYLFVGRDVTEQRRTTDLLVSTLAAEAEAAVRLRELERIKDDLVAAVSHELRTPLTNILGYVELLQDEEVASLTARQRKLIDALDRNGARLLALVDDLLTASTIDEGMLPSGSWPLDLRDVVSMARRALQPSIDGRRLTTRLHLPAAPVMVQGDARQLAQAVGNLMSNAVKFTEDGGTVECVVDVEDSRARLVVSDDGIGIPESEQAGLFTRFFRSTTAADRVIQGTGLGLSIASSIVRSHSGDISIVSAPGQGTRVIVDLPLATPA